jgi:hypothetical protein
LAQRLPASSSPARSTIKRTWPAGISVGTRVKPVLLVDVADQFDGFHGNVSLGDSNDAIIANAGLERSHRFSRDSQAEIFGF